MKEGIIFANKKKWGLSPLYHFKLEGFEEFGGSDGGGSDFADHNAGGGVGQVGRLQNG